ncbi:hypothetical protein KM043_018355 [Ampulex compressa]|nr:hypothetical protein KM043_018355 [Ampulex compressa]
MYGSRRRRLSKGVRRRRKKRMIEESTASGTKTDAEGEKGRSTLLEVNAKSDKGVRGALVGGPTEALQDSIVDGDCGREPGGWQEAQPGGGVGGIIEDRRSRSAEG